MADTEEQLLDGSAPRADARERAEVAVLLCFITVRSIMLAQAGVCTVTAWRSYRRPRLALAALGLSTLESAWLARRCWARRSFNEPLVARIDAATGVLGLVCLAGATTPEDRTAWVNWMCPVTYTTAAATTLSLTRPEAVAETGLLAGTYLATVASSLAEGGSLLSTAVANTLSYAGFFVATDAFTRRLRRSATELEAARRSAIERGERLAAERERNRQHRLLHDSALQSLEAISRGLLGPVEAREEAARSAAALRRALRGGPGAASGMRDAFEDLVVEFARRGLTVELVVDATTVPPGDEGVAALVDATREALANVVKHAETLRGVVHLSATRGWVEATIRDHGCGFDPQVTGPGFGLRQSVQGRVAEVGGEAMVWSRPRRGTRVTVRVPQ